MLTIPAVKTENFQLSHDEAPTPAAAFLTGPTHPTFVSGISLGIITFSEHAAVPGGGILKRPVVARVEVTRDGYIVSSGDFDEDGYGLTPESASVDFLTSLWDRLDSLNRRQNNLSSRDTDILQRLRTLLS